jgi:Fe-S oxidoreductase
MCPSYQVTGEEEHSTRGRARLLFEMLNGHGDGPIADGWRSEEVREALDLCLACKGCKTDCPANVDMATYKAEFLAHHYKGRLRPRADYATGWLPVAARLVARTKSAGIVNAIGRPRPLRRALTAAAGLEDRPLPQFAPQTLRQWWRARAPRPAARRGTVLLWPDTFTDNFAPHIGQAAVAVLEDAGWSVRIPTEHLCCGLTWISTGQLRTAKKVLRKTVRALAPHVRRGGLVLGLEPSCTAVFRADGPELFPDAQDMARLKDSTVTFAELLQERTSGWEPLVRRSAGYTDVIAQVHCHQHAVMKWDHDQALLERLGIKAEALESGCCGLAGNFGFTGGHGDVSKALAERVLLPRVRGASEQTAVLADGFSCRTQIRDLDSGGREGMHLAELVAAVTLPDPAERPASP